MSTTINEGIDASVQQFLAADRKDGHGEATVLALLVLRDDGRERAVELETAA